jgi:vacuolar-type H+-ATPase subunit I/STV1
MSVERLKELTRELEDLQAALSVVEGAMDAATEAEDVCKGVGIQHSHHAEMELSQCVQEITERIDHIEREVDRI